MTLRYVGDEVKEELNTRFTHHPPDEDTAAVHSLLRAWHRDLAGVIVQYLGDNRERALALTKLEESMMWANASIARRGTSATMEDIVATVEDIVGVQGRCSNQ